MGPTLFALRCSLLADDDGQFSAWKISWSPVPIKGCLVRLSRFGGLFSLVSQDGFHPKLGLLVPEVAICAFKALGPADPHLFSDEVKLQECWAVRAG